MAFVYWIHTREQQNILIEGYVGVTVHSVDLRFSQHKQLSNRKNSNLPISRAIRKYNQDLIIETLVEGSESYCYEIEYKLRPATNIGWNCRIGGEHSSQTGLVHSEETRLKMSKAKQGWKPTEKMRQTTSALMKGKKKTQESILARSSTVSAQPWLIVPQSTKKAWVNADEIYNRLTLNKESCRGVALSFGLLGGSLVTLQNKLKSGWVPNKDDLWVKFKNENSLLVLTECEKTEMRKPAPKQPICFNDWDNPSANKGVWAVALDLYEHHSKNPTDGTRKICKVFGGISTKYTKILAKLKSGWNPLTDEKYLSWLEEYKQKEAINAETQPS